MQGVVDAASMRGLMRSISANPHNRHRFDRRRMTAIVPARSFALLALLVPLGGTTGNEQMLLATICTGVSDQQVNVVRGHDVVQQLQSETFSASEQPAKIGAAVTAEPEKEVLLMTAMSDVPEVPGYEVAVGRGME